MWKTFALAAALATVLAAPAMAQSSMCSEPIAPAAVDGSTATAAQLHAAVQDVKTFLKQSDDYQVCLLRELDNAKDAAKKDKKDIDPAIPAAVDAKIKANQALKERVGAEYNTAATVYNKAHPDK
ncbi:MAG: hypothetical protein WDM91_09640 [Rhizomicrobium sp.]